MIQEKSSLQKSQEGSELYLVGKFIAPGKKAPEWSFCGIFSSMELAVNAIEEDNCFVATVTLNSKAPAEEVEFDTIIYPGNPNGEK